MACHGLTSDMVFEILVRASPETVARCKLVCREWNRITSEPRFRTLHSARAGITEGFILQGCTEFGDYPRSFVPLNGGRGPGLSLSFLGRRESKVAILASHGGMLLCVNTWAYPDRWLVCKPSTKEWTEIPNPSTGSWPTLSAMVVTRSKAEVHYKILWVAKPNWRTLVYEVFDSEAGKWKQQSVEDLTDEDIFYDDAQVVVGGTAFWLERGRHTIFSFDMYKETREKFPVTVPIPDPTPGFKMKGCIRPRLVNVDGKLGLLVPTYCGRFMELWVMENPQTRVWEKRKRIPIRKTGWRFPLAMCGTDVALVQNCYELVLYRFQSSTTQAFAFEANCCSGNRVFPYCSDSEVGTLRCFRKSECNSLPAESH